MEDFAQGTSALRSRRSTRAFSKIRRRGDARRGGSRRRLSRRAWCIPEADFPFSAPAACLDAALARARARKSLSRDDRERERKRERLWFALWLCAVKRRSRFPDAACWRFGDLGRRLFRSGGFRTPRGRFWRELGCWRFGDLGRRLFRSGGVCGGWFGGGFRDELCVCEPGLERGLLGVGEASVGFWSGCVWVKFESLRSRGPERALDRVPEALDESRELRESRELLPSSELCVKLRHFPLNGLFESVKILRASLSRAAGRLSIDRSQTCPLEREKRPRTVA